MIRMLKAMVMKAVNIIIKDEAFFFFFLERKVVESILDFFLRGIVLL